MSKKKDFLLQGESFEGRHIGPSQKEIDSMLQELDFPTLDAFISETIPQKILEKREA